MQSITKKSILITAIGVFMTFAAVSQRTKENKEEPFASFSNEQLKKKLGEFQRDKEFNLLWTEVHRKGFRRIDSERSQWGFEGELTDRSGKTQKVLFCIYDLESSGRDKKSTQKSSLIWRQVGDSIYKAYIVLPEGVETVEKALETSEEWYADARGIQKANSWGKCFLKCAQTGGTGPQMDIDIKNGKLKVGGKTYTISCPGFCMFSAACAATALTVGFVLSETGVGLAAAIVVAGACSLPCAACFAMCAIGCL
ncbi:MAG: hypothetical protein KIT80_12960 [Chitinophagaceae bacterium]|nr:hypothetical protein [Chitinophagaceae bacterium]MCW5927816.1 hypothetical protein [Chitinophagaceae bacterium]